MQVEDRTAILDAVKDTAGGFRGSLRKCFRYVTYAFIALHSTEGTARTETNYY